MMLKKKKEKEIITTHELVDLILKTDSMPAPAYSKDREKIDFIQPRGTIFSKFRKVKSLKF